MQEMPTIEDIAVAKGCDMWDDIHRYADKKCLQCKGTGKYGGEPCRCTWGKLALKGMVELVFQYQ